MPCAEDGWTPHLVGRVGRVLFGIGMIVGAYKAAVPPDVFSMKFLIAVLLTTYVSKYGINLAFQKQHWGEYTRIATGCSFVALIIIDQNIAIAHVTSIMMSSFIIAFWSFIGIAYVLCGIIGIGGCELNSYHIIWNHVKYNRCSCDQLDCTVIISPIYLLDKIEMILYK